MNVPRGRVMSKIAFIPQSGGQRSSPISLLIWLSMDHCLVGLLEEKLGQDRERKKKVTTIKESFVKAGIRVRSAASSVRVADTILM